MLLVFFFFYEFATWSNNHVHLSLPPSVTLYLSRTKKQIKREENHLMEDKKKKKQEEKKKKDAPKKVRHMHASCGWRNAAQATPSFSFHSNQPI